MSSSSPNSGFPYNPLRLTSQEFRVIRMQTSWGNLSCEMVNLDLLSRPNYKALSYVWGDPVNTRQISVNGRQFHVTENLYQFLETIRSDGTTWFYVDQICINQSEVEEKNHQVAFMGEIYKNASEVVAWLGPEANNSSLALSYIRGIPNHNSPIGQLLGPSYMQQANFQWGSQGISRAEVQAIEHLFRRRYWTRAWIVQEIMNARSLVIYCGSVRLEWSYLEEYFQIPKVYHGLPAEEYQPTEADMMLSNGVTSGEFAAKLVAEKGYFGIGKRFSYVLQNFSQWECGRPHDRIFAFLGLVGRENRVVVNYEWSMMRLYEAVMVQVARDERYLDLQSHIEFATWLQQHLLRYQRDAQLANLNAPGWVRRVLNR